MQCAGEHWHAAEPLPADEVAQLPAMLNAAKASLRPAADQEFAVLVYQFLEWADLMELGRFPADEDAKQRHIGRLTDAYSEDLGHLPADILADALKAVRRRHKWAKIPTPADVLECAADELEKRRHLHRRATTAMQAARRQAPAAPLNRPKDRYSPAEMAAAEQFAARAKAAAVPPPNRSDAGGLVPLGKRMGFTAAELDDARRAMAEASARRSAAAPAADPAECIVRNTEQVPA